jgi:hypothetical protein
MDSFPYNFNLAIVNTILITFIMVKSCVFKQVFVTKESTCDDIWKKIGPCAVTLSRENAFMPGDTLIRLPTTERNDLLLSGNGICIISREKPSVF